MMQRDDQNKETNASSKTKSSSPSQSGINLDPSVTKRFRMAEMTSPALQELIKQSPVALIPAGSNEQHGPHLPFSTDIIIASSITEHAAANLVPQHPVLVTPPISIGCSTEHLDYPGTLSTRPKTFIRYMTDIIGSLVLTGIRKILIINGHGGNRYMIGTLLHKTARKHGIFLAVTHPDHLIKDAFEQIRASKEMGGFHAGEPETSLLLHLTPHLVETEQITFVPPIKYFKETEYIRLWDSKYVEDWGWGTKEISPTGVIGNPAVATKEKGEILFKHAVENLTKLVIEIHTKIP